LRHQIGTEIIRVLQLHCNYASALTNHSVGYCRW